jgi:RNA polymerase sigma-70 factor (ECF subfamily)
MTTEVANPNRDGPRRPPAAPVVAPPAAPIATATAAATDDRAADAALLAAVAGGDPRALGDLYDRHAKLAFVLALRLVGDRRAAEDVVHDAFLAIWRGAATFRTDRGNVRSWLVAIVRNTAIDHLRARQRIVGGDDALDGAARARSGQADVGDLAAAAIDGERVRQALATLTPEQRQAVGLAFLSGLSHAEIARQLGVPLGTVKGRVRLGLARLRERLGDLGPTPNGLAGNARPFAGR